MTSLYVCAAISTLSLGQDVSAYIKDEHCRLSYADCRDRRIDA
jgi:hypothetical protein